LAAPEGYVRTFVDLGKSLVPVLNHAASRGVAPQYAARLLSAFDHDQPALPSLERQPLVEPLTERELEVLQLLAEQLSNREIGRRLFISLPTVKSHTSSIYGKLAVHSREEAVARARALAILPPP
jgi:LuxR family maltose regulon positive regulatory protein